MGTRAVGGMLDEGDWKIYTPGGAYRWEKEKSFGRPPARLQLKELGLTLSNSAFRPKAERQWGRPSRAYFLHDSLGRHGPRISVGSVTLPSPGRGRDVIAKEGRKGLLKLRHGAALSI